MNFEILQFEIYNYIDDLFNSMQPEYNVKYIETYDNASNDLEQLGKQLVYCLGLNINNLDIMIKPDYFIFNYNNIYIIINFSIDLNDVCKYKILTVKDRNEALRFRYSI